MQGVGEKDSMRGGMKNKNMRRVTSLMISNGIALNCGQKVFKVDLQHVQGSTKVALYIYSKRTSNSHEAALCYNQV